MSTGKIDSLTEYTTPVSGDLLLIEKAADSKHYKIQVSNLVTAGSGITSLNTQIGATQTFSTVSDTNVTISISSSADNHEFTVGWSGVLSEIRGGTNQSTYVLGDLLYASASNTLSKLSGNTTTTQKFLSQTGDSVNSASPMWSVINSTTVGLGNVENTALSTWAGSTNLVTVGTISSGTWHGSLIGLAYGGTGASLSNPGADRILFWDNSGSAVDWLSLGSGLSITGTTLNVSGSGITSLNSQTGTTQSFATGTSGSDFNISSATDTHTFNLPDASTTARGLVNTTTQNFIGRKDFTVSSAGTTDVLEVMNLIRETSGTAGNGLGLRVHFEIEGSTGTNLGAADIEALWVNATAGSQKGRIIISAWDNTAAQEGLRIEALSGGPGIGFLGANASLIQVGDVGTALVTYGLMGGTPTFAAGNITGNLVVTQGGTGITSLTQGDLLYSSASNTLSALNKSTSATRYLSNTGTSNNPAWAQVDLSNGVTNTLPTGNISDSAVTLPKLESRARPSCNIIINGGFDFFQRQDPATATAKSDDTYGPDRWYILTQTASINCERSTGNTARYAAKLTQNQASAQRFGIASIIEHTDSKPFRSRTIQFQFQHKSSTTQNIRLAILEWTGTADSVTSDVVNDWTSGTYTAGNFFLSSNLTVVNTSNTSSTTSYASASITGTVSSSCNNLIVMVWVESTAAQNVTLEITEAILCDGASTKDWLPRLYAEELSLCQRFYCKSFGVDTQPKQASTSDQGVMEYIVLFSGASVAPSVNVRFPNTMRSAPTMTFYSSHNSDAKWYNADGAFSSGTISQSTTTGTTGFTVTNGGQVAGDTAGQRMWGHWSAESEL